MKLKKKKIKKNKNLTYDSFFIDFNVINWAEAV